MLNAGCGCCAGSCIMVAAIWLAWLQKPPPFHQQCFVLHACITSSRIALHYPSLHSLDQLSFLVASFAAGSYFTLSLFDKLWHPDLTEAEALDMIEQGIKEIKKRLVVAPPHYIVKIIDKDGLREVKRV